ncbi:MAG: hypothetical protein JF597_05495 [Streptomyces sp.]|uniref:hypothetical protein n=1 Tax=Streptomyces sp. TaxID=1931 RepID=UPI0025EDEE95|nr:hypothetical protein [Streptomyces sp.]MBW8793048.1 hypothetical protein [Streptomyces sp.]
MVKVKIVGRIKKYLSGCRGNCTQGSDKCTQKMRCEYVLDMKSPPAQSPGATRHAVVASHSRQPRRDIALPSTADHCTATA